MAETLNRLGLPFAVYGFQDVLIPLRPYGEEFNEQSKKAIGGIIAEIEGNRAGGHNQPGYNDDGPCVLEAAQLLMQQPNTDKIMIVVSDGEPAGRRSNENDLHNSVRRLTNSEIQLIALGLGADTGHVLKFYPRAKANIPLDQFATEIAALIGEAITDK